ncbi:MAG: FAD-binding protein [Segetibacter sp.]|nr:FAD-binding protein [Segetibacter sp.]
MSENTTYDVAVVGGGLAGLCLSIQCAQQGFSVILFEKETYPFHKVCGEFISNESRNFLERVDVDFASLNLPSISKLLVTDVYGKQYNFPLDTGGFGISRYRLDNLLYQSAISTGVKVLCNTKVDTINLNDDEFEVSAGKKKITAKVVAGCYGKRANIDVKWKRPFTLDKPSKLNNYIGVKYHVRYEHDREQIALHNFKDGYCGISKIEDDKSCLCYLTTASNLKQAGNSIKNLEEQILYKNPFLEEIFTSAEFLYAEPLTISQVSFAKKSQVEKSVLLVGDTAGMIAPLCGNGMSMAMHGSKIAFECINQFLAGKATRQQMETAYSNNWKSQFSKRLFTGRVVQKLFGGTLSTVAFLRVMHAVPLISKPLIAATHGKSF